MSRRHRTLFVRPLGHEQLSRRGTIDVGHGFVLHYTHIGPFVIVDDPVRRAS